MKERSKYHVWDIINITIFYSVFICFLVADILAIVSLCKNEISWQVLFLRLVFTFLMCAPYIVKKTFKVTFSRLATSVFYFYMFLAAFLGVELELYRKVECWDIIIHFVMGALISVLSIYVLNLTIYKKKNVAYNYAITFVFMFCFTMTVGAVWEIIEFCTDGIFGQSFQRFTSYAGDVLVGRDALFDTMIDIICDFFGAITGILFTVVACKVDKHFLNTFNVRKLKSSEVEVEDIEE